MDKLNILLPVEAINRELDSRLFMAVHLGGPARRIIVGQHDLLFGLMPHVRGGIWLGKNVFPREAPWETYERYNAVRANDFVVLHLDEEGAVFPGGPDQWPKWIHQRLDVTRLDSRDWVFTWGDFQREVYRAVSNVSANLITTGHPRFDICTPAFDWYHRADVEALRAKYGRFVLVNTNLVYPNPGSGHSLTFDKSSGWDVTSPSARVKFLEMYAHTSRVLTGFLSLVNRLSIEYPELTVVVRPHPSESFELYRTVFAGIPNVKVVHEGSVVPWIAASVAMIHDGCTTGIEGSFTGRPVLNFMGIEALEFDPQLPNQIGTRCDTEEAVLASVGRLLHGETVEARPVPAVAREMLANYEMRSLPALEEAVTSAAAMVKRDICRFNQSGMELAARKALWARRARNVVRAVGPAALRKRMTEARFVELADQMFYGFSGPRVAERIRLIADKAGRTARVRFVTEELFIVEVD